MSVSVGVSVCVCVCSVIDNVIFTQSLSSSCPSDLCGPWRRIFCQFLFWESNFYFSRHFLCVCVCTRVCVFMCACTYVEARLWLLFLRSPPLWFLLFSLMCVFVCDRVCQQDQGFANSARLSGHQAPGIPLSLPHLYQDYTHVPFQVVCGIKLRSSCTLAEQVFYLLSCLLSPSLEVLSLLCTEFLFCRRHCSRC